MSEFEARQLIEQDSELKEELKQEYVEKTKPIRNDIEGFTAKDLMNMELPAPKFIIPGVLTEGLNLLAGPPKVGKSWMVLDAAIAVASGTKFLGSIPVDKGNVVYLALEDNKKRLQSRVKMVLQGRQVPENLYLYIKWPRIDTTAKPDKDGARLLDAFVEKYNIRLIIIDTLAKIKPKSKGSNNNVYNEDYSSVEALKAVADKHNLGIVVVHHVRKMGSDDTFETISGSYGLTGGTDGMLVLKKDRARCDGVLSITGRDTSDKELALKWNEDTVSWTIIGNAAEYRMSQERQAITDILKASNVPMGGKDIAVAIGKNYNTVRYFLSCMYKDGQIQKHSEGKYYIYQTQQTDTTNKQYQQPKQHQQIQQCNVLGSVGDIGTAIQTVSTVDNIRVSKGDVCNVGVVGVDGTFDEKGGNYECPF